MNSSTATKRLILTLKKPRVNPPPSPPPAEVSPVVRAHVAPNDVPIDETLTNDLAALFTAEGDRLLPWYPYAHKNFNEQ